MFQGTYSPSLVKHPSEVLFRHQLSFPECEWEVCACSQLLPFYFFLTIPSYRWGKSQVSGICVRTGSFATSWECCKDKFMVFGKHWGLHLWNDLGFPFLPYLLLGCGTEALFWICWSWQVVNIVTWRLGRYWKKVGHKRIPCYPAIKEAGKTIHLRFSVLSPP